MHKRNSERVLITPVAAEKQTVLHITRVCVALVTQQENRIFYAQHYIVICGLPESTIFFPHYLKRQDFRKKEVTEHEM